MASSAKAAATLAWAGLGLLMLAAGCTTPPSAPVLAVRALPSEAPVLQLQAYFPEIPKSHVGLSYLFDPTTGAGDPAVQLPPTPEARWILSYLGEAPAGGGGSQPLLLPIPASHRAPIRNDLLSVELWLAHAEAVYVSNYLAAQRPGAKLRYSPWVESFGMTAWKMNHPFAEPLGQSRLANVDGVFYQTGSSLDLALSSPAGSVTFFGVVNDAGQLIGLTRDGRLYRAADRRLTSLYGPLEGLANALLPPETVQLQVSAAGIISGTAGAEQKETFAFGPPRIYRLPLATVESLGELDGLYSLPPGTLPDSATVADPSAVLQVGRREQPVWTASWYYRNLRSLSETRALAHAMLERLDEALIRDQTTPPPVKLEVKTDVAPFLKIFQDWASDQSGARRRPPLRFRHDRRMVLCRAYFAARKSPVRADGDDIVLEFPSGDSENGRTPTEQIARLLADCARYLKTRMTVVADNAAHMYEIVETIQVGAERKPRQDRAPRRVSLDENTGAYEVQPLDKPFRTRLVPGNANAIDAIGTVYCPNVSAAEAADEYKNLESEYRFILKALAVVQPELILEDPPALNLPAKPADWQE